MHSSEMRASWRSALVAFVLLVAFNSALGLVWVVLGFPLRGMDYEPGRPTVEDIWASRVVEVVTYSLLTVNVLVPLYFAVRRRFDVVMGLVAAWIASPLAFWLSVWTLAAVRIALG